MNRLRLQSIVDRKSYKAFSSELVSRLGSYSNLLHTNRSILKSLQKSFRSECQFYIDFLKKRCIFLLLKWAPVLHRISWFSVKISECSLLFIIFIFVWYAIEMQIHGNYSLMTDDFVTLPLGCLVGQKCYPPKY